MTTYQVSMQRSENLSEEERRRRLHQAYLFILSLRPKHNHDQEHPEDQAPLVASDTLTEEPKLQAEHEES